MPIDLPQFTWRKSSYSGDNVNCVEVGWQRAEIVGLRDSKAPARGALLLSRTSFSALLRTVRR